MNWFGAYIPANIPFCTSKRNCLQTGYVLRYEPEHFLHKSLEVVQLVDYVEGNGSIRINMGLDLLVQGFLDLRIECQAVQISKESWGSLQHKIIILNI